MALARAARTAAAAPYRTLTALTPYEELIATGAWWDYVADAAVRGRSGAPLPDVAPGLRVEWSDGRRPVEAPRRRRSIAQVRRKARAPTSRCCRPSASSPPRGDREFFIRKAIGWALRAYAWVAPDAVRATATPTS